MTRRAHFLSWLAVACFGIVGGVRAENAVSLGNVTADPGDLASVPVMVSGDKDIQGAVIVFEWQASRGTGESIDVADGAGEPLEGADLVVTRVEDAFMVFSVVMDTNGEDIGTIPAGDNTEVATAQIRCATGGPTGVRTTLSLVDEKYATVDGGPELTNLIVSDGRSITDEEDLVKRNGSFTCGEATGDGPPVFACGGSLNDDGQPGDVVGKHETAPTVTFYYRAPEDSIQGLSMAVTFDCALTAEEDTFDISGGVLAPEASDAEFVHIDVDNASRGTDGDGCEFILGVLIDAVPPFDGRMLPPTATFAKVFSMDFAIEDDAMCDHCLWLKFMDGLDGNGTPPVKNLVAIDFFSESPETLDCQVCVEGEPEFIRGDCNFSGEIMMGVNIADAAAQVGYFFLEGDQKFEAPCEKACDANDDGRLDASDVVFLLGYMFIPDSPVPPAPGPLFPGVDETPDDLTCEGGPKKC